MENCKYCDKPAVVLVGKDKTPVCEEHYIVFLKGFMKIVEELVGIFQ
jgi:hypothetical protein